MRLAHVTVARLSHPRPHVFLSVADGEGNEGHGEAAPLPPFSRDDADTAARALDRARDRVAIPDGAAGAGDAARGALRLLGRDLDEAPSARFALETALFDLCAQRAGVSVAEALGGSPAARVPVNALLALEPLDTLVDRAAAAAAEGYAAIKIKLRAPGEAGFARERVALAAVRARLPLPFEIRLDPNAAWTIAEAGRRLAALAEIQPAYVEQPVGAADLPRLGEQPVPWAADESLADPALVDRLLSARGCAAFVIKPAVVGGLLRARDIAIRAQDRGIGVVITHFFDGPWSLAAAAELAASLPRPPLACGLAPHDRLDAFAANARGVILPQIAARGFVRSSGGPGLGVRSTWVCHGHG